MKAKFEGILVQGISRRAFLVSAGGATVAVAFGGLVGMRRALAQAKEFQPNGWMRVAADGTVTIYSPASEMGQGVMTAMPLLIAEEMDLDWGKVKVEQAPYVPKTFGNPMFGGGMITGASRTTRGYYQVMRIAGMQARYVMMYAAAKKWGVPIFELSTEPHQVVHAASGRKLGYGEIAAFAEMPAGMPEYTAQHLKPAAKFRLVGKDFPRVDVPDKSMGKAQYGIDVRMPGMLYGTVLASPVEGEKPDKVDDAAAKKVPGVKAVVPLPYGVGVVADSYWAARKARNLLKVTWSTGSKARAYSSDRIAQEYLVRARNLGDNGVEFMKHGDPEGALKGAAKVLQAEYVTEHTAHACMEPMNATARVDGDKIEVWAPSQSDFLVHLALMLGLKYKPENITSHITLLGGGFGRRVEADYVVDAAILAKAVEGQPVKVVWSREDDIQRDKWRPLVAQHLAAGIDARGNLVALRHRLVAESIFARNNPPAFQQSGGRDAAVCEGGEHTSYDVPNHVLYYLREQRGVGVGFWRGVGSGYTKFAIEGLMDELAAAAGKDSVEFRLQQLGKDPRGRAVVEEAARMADWKKKRPAGRALGFAYSDTWETYCAQAAEVSVDRKTGKVRVHEIWCAVDCGVALQPRNVAAQIESAIMYGVSAALGERVSFKGGAPQQSNFHDYRVLRMNEAPLVHVKVLVTDNKPGGIGEVGLPPVAPAIANAIARITGKRLRKLPLEQGLLKA